MAWQYWNNKATAAELLAHLQQCDSAFVEVLAQRTDLATYANKLTHYAERFEAWANGQLVGVIALYCNDTKTRQAYISHVSTLPAWQGQGIAKKLLNRSCDYARAFGMTHIQLEVAADNHAALRLYQQHNFSLAKESLTNWKTLCLTL